MLYHKFFTSLVKNEGQKLILCWIVAGMDDPNNIFISIDKALKDEKRVKYHNEYLTNLLAAIK